VDKLKVLAVVAVSLCLSSCASVTDVHKLNTSTGEMEHIYRIKARGPHKISIKDVIEVESDNKQDSPLKDMININGFSK